MFSRRLKRYVKRRVSAVAGKMPNPKSDFGDVVY
jgi:hypothetical protein